MEELKKQSLPIRDKNEGEISTKTWRSYLDEEIPRFAIVFDAESYVNVLNVLAEHFQ